MIEIRTANHIMADLLEFTEDQQYSGETNIECHCHPRYVKCCPCCYVLDEKEHLPDCKISILIKEATAFIEAENEILWVNGEELI